METRILMPELRYRLDALQPVISMKTMEFHYGKHLQGYVDKTNVLLQGTGLERCTLEVIIKEAEGNLLNNAAQVYNHKFYFEQFSPTGGGIPIYSNLINLIERSFNSWNGFYNLFNEKAISLFGSGYTWLVYDKSDDQLHIINYENAENPLDSDILYPILCFDIWEHAYYLDYQNRRKDHVEALWNIIDWSVIEDRFNIINQIVAK